MISWGLPALIGSLSVFIKLKKKKKKVETLDAAITPPVLNIPFEATNTATLKLSGYSSPNTKVEIYIDDQLVETIETDSDGAFNIEALELALGINNIYGKTINEKGNSSLASKTIKLIYNNEQPILEVTEPSDGQEIKGGDKKIRVSGKTEPINSITINGVTAIVNGDGNFSKEISLNDGDNLIEVVAINQVGNSTKHSVTVKYSP